MPYRALPTIAQPQTDVTAPTRVVGFFAVAQLVWSLATLCCGRSFVADQRTFELGRVLCLVGSIIFAIVVARCSRGAEATERRVAVAVATLLGIAAAVVVVRTDTINTLPLAFEGASFGSKADLMYTPWTAAARVATVLYGGSYAAIAWAVTRPNARVLAWLAIASAVGTLVEHVANAASFEALHLARQLHGEVGSFHEAVGRSEAVAPVALVAAAIFLRRRDDLESAAPSLVSTLAAGIVVCAASGFCLVLTSLGTSFAFDARLSSYAEYLPFAFGSFLVGAVLVGFVARKLFPRSNDTLSEASGNRRAGP